MKRPRKNRILVVEDHTIVIESLEQYLHKIYPNALIDFCTTVNAGLDKLEEYRYRFVISDLGFENKKRFEIVELCKSLNIPCIVLTGFCHAVFLKRALEIGVQGYIIKTSPLKEIENAIRNLCSDEPYLCPQAAALDIEDILDENDSAPVLNHMEEIVLRYTIEGLDQREIAMAIGKSYHLVRHYRREMLKKNNCTMSVLIKRYVEWHH